MPLDAQIEAVLFWKGEPLSIKKLAEILKKSEDEILAGLAELEQKLAGRGLALMRKESEVMLATHKDASELITRLTKEELIRDLGKAGLETLSIILYRGPVARRDIDYIRGVNSNFILRNLLVRGLVERVQSPNDQRSFLYKPTFELLSHLGVRTLEDLPEYQDVQREITAHQRALDEESNEPQKPQE
jgi:segregation and condensation protein B